MKGKENKKEKKKEKAADGKGKAKVQTEYQRDKFTKQDKGLTVKW